MKKHFAWFPALFILMALTGCNGDQKESPVPALLEPVGVQMDVAEVQMDDIFNITTYNGEILPYVEELAFQVDGILAEMNVVIGEPVKEGQVLAALSEEEILERMEVLEDEIGEIVTLGAFSDRQAEADIKIAEVELERLLEAGGSTQASRLKEVDIQKLRLNLEQAGQLRQLELQEKQSELKNLKDKLGKNVITAPFDGRIVYISDAEKGDSIQGYTTVFCIADDSRLHLTSDYISESVITGADKIYAKIMDKEYPITYIPMDNGEYIAKVLAGEEIQAQFTVEAQEGELESGQFAVVMILDSLKENVLTVPINALYRDENGRYVYKMVDGQRIRCNVTVGMTTDIKAEIKEGLEEGDMVYVKE